MNHILNFNILFKNIFKTSSTQKYLSTEPRKYHYLIFFWYYLFGKHP